MVKMIRDLAGPTWILHTGEVYEFDALREHHWISCGYCVSWSGEEQKAHEPSEDIGLSINLTVNGKSCE